MDRTTIGRVEDNTFQIADPSVSSHHCEMLLRGNDVVVKDLNSTNGTFINNQQITDEAVLKPGQMLRLGQVEMRLESGSSGAGVAAGQEAGGFDHGDFQGRESRTTGTGAARGFDTTKGGFTKKDQQDQPLFHHRGMVVFCVVIGGVLALPDHAVRQQSRQPLSSVVPAILPSTSAPHRPRHK